MFCPKCGNKVSDIAKFCGKCGYKFEKRLDESLTKNSKIKKIVITVLACCICVGLFIYWGEYYDHEPDWDYGMHGNGRIWKAEIHFYNGNETDVIIPDSVKGEWFSTYEVDALSGTFEGYSNLRSVEIPDGVTRIGSRTFSGCTNLTSIEIPDSVTEIGESAFEGCSSLASIEIPDSVTYIGVNAFAGCTDLTSIEIPDGVTEIRESAFAGCTDLTSVEMAESVTEIRESAFEGCSSLTSIEIPDGVTRIGSRTFAGCTDLTNVEIPDGVTVIEESVFKDCSSLTGIEIPDTVWRISDNAFEGCENLPEILYMIAGDIIQFGNYEQDNNTTNGKEPIEWIVLEREGNKLFLLSKYVLDKYCYANKYYVDWVDSDVRWWLNNDFFANAFDESEQMQIVDTKIANPGLECIDIANGESTVDKIFLLSVDEVANYGYKRAEGTAYLREGIGDIRVGEANNVTWWTRSPAISKVWDYAFIVDPDVYAETPEPMCNAGGSPGSAIREEGIRPAMWVSLN